MEKDVPRMAGEWHIEYKYSMGKAAAAFFAALREHRILGSRCGECGRVSVPPKAYCEFCFVEVSDLREVGPYGQIESATVVTAEFKGSPPVPYCVAFVQLDGASSSIANYVRGVDMDGLEDGGELPSEIHVGAKVRAVFAPEATGRVTDFWFEPAGERVD
ncbi:MAG: Zn-ribbon domain-containing OB-fold protein [Actinomycetota bacterium]